jgi:hypothetical protein
MRRLEEKVIPRWEVMKKELPVTVARRSRRERKSYEEYEAALKKEVSRSIFTVKSDVVLTCYIE